MGKTAIMEGVRVQIKEAPAQEGDYPVKNMAGFLEDALTCEVPENYDIVRTEIMLKEDEMLTQDTRTEDISGIQFTPVKICDNIDEFVDAYHEVPLFDDWGTPLFEEWEEEDTPIVIQLDGEKLAKLDLEISNENRMEIFKAVVELAGGELEQDGPDIFRKIDEIKKEGTGIDESRDKVSEQAAEKTAPEKEGPSIDD